MMALAAAGVSVVAHGVENAPKPLRVLFIGNSYTFYNNLPDTIATLGARDGANWTVKRYLRGGASFRTHWFDNLGEAAERVSDAKKRDPTRVGGLDKLLKEKWDAVVLQGQSQEAIKAREEFLEYGRKLAEKIKASGCSRILLYQTWARQAIPDQQSGLSEGYDTLAAATGAEVVRVGDAWAAAFKARPGLVLHVKDGSHPNDRGSYLAACLFYRALSGRKAKGLPYDLPNVKWRRGGGTAPCYNLDAEIASFLQGIADR